MRKLLERIRRRAGELAETTKERVGELPGRRGEARGRLRKRGKQAGKVLRARGGQAGRLVTVSGKGAGKLLRRRGRRATGKPVGSGGKRLRRRASRVGEELREGGRHAGKRVEGVARRGRAQLSSVKIRRRKERSVFGLVFNKFTVGFGAGYLLGTRAGRERYEQIVGWWRSVTGSPTVQQMAERGRGLAEDVGRTASREIRGRMTAPQTVRDVMTPNPRTVRPSSTLSEAAQAMRDVDAGAMVVVDETDNIIGILTDRDIAIRAVAEGRDALTTTVGDVASREPTTVSPNDSTQRAIQLMEERAVRRLPVVEGGKPVGIVSLGDLAVEHEPRSTLAEISTAPANE